MAAISYEARPCSSNHILRANIAGAISPAQIEFIQKLKMIKIWRI